MFAYLWHQTQGNITKHEFMHSYDDWFMQNAIFRANQRTEPGEYWPAERIKPEYQPVSELSPLTLFMKHKAPQLRQRGWTEEQIKAKLEEYTRSYQGHAR